jgi:polyketide synthase PksN
MEERLAVKAGSIKDLREKLEGFLEGREGSEDLYRGQVKRHKETLTVFAGDEEIQEAIEKWVQRGKFGKFPDLWVKGLPIDWEKLYRGAKQQKPRRISLPTYPFAGKPYWIHCRGASAEEIPVHSPGSDTRTDIPYKDLPVRRISCFLIKKWEPCPQEPGIDAPTLPRDRTIAILTTEETGDLATLVSQYFPGSQILDTQELRLQTRASQQQWKNYDGCVDLSGCSKNKNQVKLMDRVAWLQQLIEPGRHQGLMLLGVTRGLESYQNRAVNLSGAAQAGLYRMLQSEYSHLRSRHLDVDPAGADKDLARQIVAEFFMDSRDPEVCYRGGKRYRACLREYQPGDKDREPVLTFPADHVLWITGGTRGLGYLCARHFVTRHGVKRLVLTGREVLPPRRQWDAYRQENNALAKKIRAVRELEDLGAQVRVLSMALTDEHAVQQDLQEVKKSMGPIGGIIHCAGVADRENPAFTRKSMAGIRQVLEPKVAGLDIMVQCFKNEPLRFFALFSSVSAIIPVLAVGQSDYAMANAYMDYAAEAYAQDCPLVSIQWPSWKETGMGEVKTRAYLQSGLLSLGNEEGLYLLDQIFSGNSEPVVLPAVVNPDVWQPRQLMQRTLPEPAGSPAALVKATEAWLISLFSKELHVEPSKLQIDTPFQDYGLESVLLAQILARLNQKLMMPEDLDPSVLYEHPTIESLAAWLTHTHANSLAAVLAAPAAEPPAPPPQDSSPVLSLPSISSPGRAPVRGFRDSAHLAEAAQPADIAVIGLSCRFPGAPGLEEYWKLLSEGRSAIRQVPRERWGYDNSFYAGLLDNIRHFDAKFFLIPLEDARVMDPQAFLLLEESLKLWYHAGYTPHEIKGKPVGVFLGGRSLHQPDFSSLQQARNPIVAVGQNYLAANICQFFDLQGPALVLDTACSSALVGMNMAIQALRGGEIESALVGGVNLLKTDRVHRLFQQRGILSRGPLFHIFDRRAGGVVPGEGVGVVLLKTVEQALADGDFIYAVIKAIAINNDGRTAGPATPNLEALKRVLKTALAKSGKTSAILKSMARVPR